MNIYIKNALFMAVLWVFRYGFHSISTSLSHKATFAVLGNIRKRVCEKLSRLPIGFVCYALMTCGYDESYQNTFKFHYK